MHLQRTAARFGLQPVRIGHGLRELGAEAIEPLQVIEERKASDICRLRTGDCK